MKREKILKETANRRVYHILHTADDDPYNECLCCCPMRDHCSKHPKSICHPKRVRERNWKSQRKNQWKNRK